MGYILLISDNVSCTYNYCEPNEFASWSVGNLAGGSSKTVTLPPRVSLATPDGTQIDFDIEVFESGAQVAMLNHSVAVKSDRQFDIAVDESLNPVAPGQELSYTITYANRGSISTTNTRLSFPLPNDVSFVSASGGGVFSGNVVEWDLHTFSAKKGGKQTVIVDVKPNVAYGTQLEVDATEITGDANLRNHSVKAMAVTTIKNTPALALKLELNPDPVQPGERLQSELIVSNTSAEIKRKRFIMDSSFYAFEWVIDFLYIL